MGEPYCDVIIFYKNVFLAIVQTLKGDGYSGA